MVWLWCLSGWPRLGPAASALFASSAAAPPHLDAHLSHRLCLCAELGAGNFYDDVLAPCTAPALCAGRSGSRPATGAAPAGQAAATAAATEPTVPPSAGAGGAKQGVAAGRQARGQVHLQAQLLLGACRGCGSVGGNSCGGRAEPPGGGVPRCQQRRRCAPPARRRGFRYHALSLLVPCLEVRVCREWEALVYCQILHAGTV